MSSRPACSKSLMLRVARAAWSLRQTEAIWQPIRLRGKQGERDRLGRQVRGEGQQLQRRRLLDRELIKRQLVARGQRRRVGHRCCLREHVRGPRLQQPQVLRHGHPGLGQVRTGLAHREWQVAQRGGDPPSVRLGQSQDPRAQHPNRLIPVEHLHREGNRELLPPWVAGGDHHMASTAGQVADQRNGVLGVVIDQQPSGPVPQCPQHSRHRRHHAVRLGSQVQGASQLG